MKRPWVLTLAVLLLVSVAVSGSAMHASAAHAPKKHCVWKTVKKRVHGKTVKVKRKVCTTVKLKPKSTPTATVTPLPTATATETALDPNQFALPLSDFPPGTTDVLADGTHVNQVESDTQADADALLLHYGGVWELEGRLTGYAMETFQPNTDSYGTNHATLIAYLVSTFSTSAQARAAWQQQRQGWLAVDPTGGSCPASTLGDPGYICADSNSSSGGGTFGELFFVRGRIEVEVYSYLSTYDLLNNFDTVAVPLAGAVHGVAVALDGIAVGEHAMVRIVTHPVSDLRAALNLGWVRGRTLGSQAVGRQPPPLARALARGGSGVQGR